MPSPEKPSFSQLERFESFNEFYLAVDKVMRPVLAANFPDAAAAFLPPTVYKIRNDFENHLELTAPWINEPVQPAEAADLRTALKTVALIRYLDDFIDDHVWPKLDLQSVKDRQKFSSLLKDFLVVAQTLEPSFTGASLEIFKVEARLAAEPTQANFDRNFRELFRTKSYDIVLCYCQAHHLDIHTMHTELVMMGIVDCCRDFDTPLKTQPADSTDFDLYRFIVDHQINPRRMVAFIETALHHLNHDVFKRYERGETAEQMQSTASLGSGILLIVQSLELLKAL